MPTYEIKPKPINICAKTKKDALRQASTYIKNIAIDASENTLEITEDNLHKARQRIMNQEIHKLANATGQLYLDFYFGCISIDNQNPPDLINYHEDQEIFQWFIVSEWFASHAEKNGLTILQTDDLNFWGRTCCGVAIDYTTELDDIIYNAGLLPKQEQA